MMIFFRACPRCSGDMHVNRDIYGDYKECLNCGNMQDLESPDALRTLISATTMKKRKRKVA
jgi:DNA-directed RNA polymerase subunit M/transcription elongation factor TFIIS